MAQKLRLTIGTFTHWAHVIPVCVLQAEMMSYIEVKFCMCVIIQKLFLVSFFTVIRGDFSSSHYLAPLLLFKLSYLLTNLLTYSMVQSFLSS